MPVDKELKSRLSTLKRSRRFVRWGESAGLARELRDLLQQIEDQVEDAQLGCKLVADFYTTDHSVFGRCDDSSGHVGDVYRYDACELFVDYAKHCVDKPWLTKLILKTSLKDNYGVRDALVNSAEDFLPAAQLRWLIDQYQQVAEKGTDEFPRRHWLYQIESLARQLKDAPLFEQTRRAAWGMNPAPPAASTSPESIWNAVRSRPPSTWLERIPAGEAFNSRSGTNCYSPYTIGRETTAAGRGARRSYAGSAANRASSAGFRSSARISALTCSTRRYGLSLMPLSSH